MWILLSFVTALCESGKDVLGKIYTTRTDPYLTAFALKISALVVVTPLLVINPPAFPAPSYFWIWCVSLLVVPVTTTCYLRAINLSPLSRVLPVLALNPILTALLAYIFDGRLPTLIGWFGVVAISGGLYVNRLDQKRSAIELLAPLTSIFIEPGSRYMLTVCLLWSIGAHLSRILVHASTPFLAAFAVFSAGSLGLLPLVLLRSRFDRQVITGNWRGFGLLGIFHALSEVAMSAALLTGFTPYVIAIKRTNIIWSSLAGRAFFDENLRGWLLPANLLVVAGIFLLLVGR